MSLPIVVIGGGLSGLYAAHLLEQAGQRVLLIEARERLGGRILSLGHADDRHRLDLGPSWFWPAMNPLVAGLVSTLGLDAFAQHIQGATAIEGPDGQVHRQQVTWQQSPASYRVAGGMQRLIEGLRARLEGKVHILTGTRVVGLKLRPHAVELDLQDASGAWTQQAAQVVLTIPPRLTVQDLCMEPAWPLPLVQQMRDTPSWMAGQAKFVAVYPRAFWREAGWSGTAMSHRGPLAEIHDASDASGETAALFGFVGATPAYRTGIGQDALTRQALAQLQRIFGEQAGSPLWTAVQDWAEEPLTAAASDRQPLARHPLYDAGTVPQAWSHHLWLAGTERSANAGGYLEGALESAALAVQELLAQRSQVPGTNASEHERTLP
ncbi:MAG: FAD-dependent oxidoreductase [Acidovorax sp.]|uniref:flavin monoamine oxidase family protein n=1 Tax=Acidovorax sp. TaxID=1872122 RepID=UPI002623CA4A|nr:FAD-dependent oxidoreductase [Acidovorax sp.]MDH4463318.1 FAD-dependent oxidoreductase [Acidovorax sp.]